MIPNEFPNSHWSKLSFFVTHVTKHSETRLESIPRLTKIR